MATLSPHAQPRDEPVTLIRPSRGWVSLNLRDLWRYRELVAFLTWRDLSVRYKQTALGVAWAVLQPLLTMLVFSLFFGRLGRIPSDGLPYPIFTFCALLPWQLFAHALTESSNSLIANERLITKVYFPRLIIPLAATLAGLMDFAIALVMLFGLMVYYGITPTAAIWTLPLFVALALVTALGIGLWLSALNVQYRDVRYTLPFLTQFWFFLTPIAYPFETLPEGWRPLLAVNPATALIHPFQRILYERGLPDPATLGLGILWALGAIIAGVFVFERLRQRLVEEI